MWRCVFIWVTFRLKIPAAWDHFGAATPDGRLIKLSGLNLDGNWLASQYIFHVLHIWTASSFSFVVMYPCSAEPSKSLYTHQQLHTSTVLFEFLIHLACVLLDHGRKPARHGENAKSKQKLIIFFLWGGRTKQSHPAKGIYIWNSNIWFHLVVLIVEI